MDKFFEVITTENANEVAKLLEQTMANRYYAKMVSFLTGEPILATDVMLEKAEILDDRLQLHLTYHGKNQTITLAYDILFINEPLIRIREYEISIDVKNPSRNNKYAPVKWLMIPQRKA